MAWKGHLQTVQGAVSRMFTWGLVLTAIVLFYSGVIADPYERFAALRGYDGVVQADHMECWRSNRVEMTVGVVPAYKPTDADAIFDRNICQSCYREPVRGGTYILMAVIWDGQGN